LSFASELGSNNLFFFIFFVPKPPEKRNEAVGTKEYSELPRAKALRLPASTTDSIPLTGYGGLISTGLTSLHPVGTIIGFTNKLYTHHAIHHHAKALVLSCLVISNAVISNINK